MSRKATRDGVPEVPPVPDERAAPAGPAFGNVDRILGPWLVAGVVAALAMMAFAMVATWMLGRGFYTPLYFIASIYDRVPLDTSFDQIRRFGNHFYYRHEPLVLGMAVQVTMGGVLGLLFGLTVRSLRPRGRMTLLVGAAYGLLVMAVAGLVLFPLAARAFGGGAAVARIPLEIGLGLFTAEHLIFGLMLAVWALLRPRDVFATPRPLKG